MPNFGDGQLVDTTDLDALSQASLAAMPATPNANDVFNPYLNAPPPQPIPQADNFGGGGAGGQWFPPSSAADVVYGNGKYGSPSGPLSMLSIGDVGQFQKNVLIPNTRGKVGAGPDKGTGAVGAYQITYGTLNKYAPQVFGPDWQGVQFNLANQDALAEAIWNDARGGDLHNTWASLPHNRPGQYANVPWSAMRSKIAAGESGGRGVTHAAAAPSTSQNFGSGTPVEANMGQGTPVGSAQPQQEGWGDWAWRKVGAAAGAVESSVASGLQGLGQLADVTNPASTGYMVTDTGVIPLPGPRETSTAGGNLARKVTAPMQRQAQAIMPNNPTLGERVIEGVAGFVPAVGASFVDPLLGAGMFGAQGMAEAHDEALAHGASEETAQRAGVENAGISAGLSLVPGERLVGPIAGRLFAPVLKSAEKVGPKTATAAMRTTDAATEMAGTGTVVGGMQFGSNVVAQQNYDPNRPLFENVPTAFGEGALASGAIHGAGAVYRGVTGRGRQAPIDGSVGGAGTSPSGAEGTAYEMPPTDAVWRYANDGRAMASDDLRERAAEAGVVVDPHAAHDDVLAKTVEAEAKNGAPTSAAVDQYQRSAGALLSPHDIDALNVHLANLSGGQRTGPASAATIFGVGDVYGAGPPAADERAQNPESGGAGAPQVIGAAEAAQAHAQSVRPPVDVRLGADSVAIVPGGREIPVQYGVVDADQLIASHEADGRVNPDYPSELQPRDRARGVSEIQIATMAANLDPRLLGESYKASDGAPIIAPDGTVESGNGRTLAILRAYERHPEAAQRYRDMLAAQGFDLTGIDKPMLVRVRQGDMAPEEVQAFTREANARDTLGYSATEQARADAASLPDNALSLYHGGDVESAANRDFVKAFMTHAVPAAEHAGMVSADGSLSQQAITRIRSALLAKAYGDADLIGNVVESTDTNIKAIGGALTDIAGAWAKLREGVRDGRIEPEMDITPHLLDAVRMVDAARKGSTPTDIALRDALNQGDMFSGHAVDPITEAVLRLMFRDDDFKQARGRQRLADALGVYLEQAEMAVAGEDLFGASTKASAHDILAHAIGKSGYAEAEPQADLLGSAVGAGDVARMAGEDRADGGGEELRTESSPEIAGAAELAVANAPFDADAWNKARDDRIAASKASGIIHLDQVDPSVETMRGRVFYNVHDPKEHGTIRTVANNGDVVVHWADQYSADKNLAEEKSEKGKPVHESWLMPRDLKDYAFGKPHAEPEGEPVRGAAELAAHVDATPEPRLEERLPLSEAKPKRRSKTATEARLEDVGEKIGGARKDQWAERGLGISDLEAMNDREAFTNVVKDQVWPKPDYARQVDEGVEPLAAALKKIIRDRLAARPKTDSARGRRDYIEMMGLIREELDNAKTVEDIKSLSSKVLYDRLGWPERGMPPTELRHKLFSVFKGRKTELGVGYDELRRAQALIDKGFPGEIAPWKRQFDIRKDRDGNYAVYGKKSWRPIDKFASQEEAEARAAALYEESKGAKEGGKLPQRPHLDEVQRTGGPDVRKGANVTGEDFLKDFGFRAMEFGNWVASDERQKVANLAYDALRDLADVLDVDPKALSLDGKLALAFGARGKGNALAHYEPDRLVINMTKLQGAGSLAHEFGHALDHYFGELDRGETSKGAVTGASGWYDRSKAGAALGNLRPEMSQAFQNLMLAIFKTDKPRAAAVRDKELALEQLTSRLSRMRSDVAKSTDKSFIKDAGKWLAANEPFAKVLGEQLAELRDEKKPYTPVKMRSSYDVNAGLLSGKSGSEGYWARPTEMFARAFESYVFDRIAERERKSDYLVQGVEPGRYAEGYKGNPYPAGAEREAINRAFDHLFETMEERPGEHGGVALYSRAEGGQTATPEFKRWFGDSKVVDAEGKPLVVYHSTNTAFDKFRRRVGDVGMHFGTAGQANDRIAYMEQHRGIEGQQVMPVFLRIRNPFRMEDAGAWNAGNMNWKLAETFPADKLRISRMKSTKDIREFLQSKGYDGIVYRNTGETAGVGELRAAAYAARNAAFDAQRARGKSGNSFDREDQQTPEYQAMQKAEKTYSDFRENNAEDSYIAFDPTQIKSATGNTGAFSPTDARIRYSKAEGPGQFDAARAKALADDLRDRLRAMGIPDSVALRIRNSMAEMGGAQGSYWPARRVIEVALDAKDDHSFVLDHEVVHYLRDQGVFTPEDWATVAQAARNTPDIWDSVARRYADKTDGEREEEAVADMFGRFQTGEFSPQGLLERILFKAIKFLSAIRNAFRGAGFKTKRTFHEVFGEMARGEMAPDGVRGAADVARASQEMRVYHGSPHDFDEFSLDHIGSGEGAQAYGHGLYFAGKKEIAEHYRQALSLRQSEVIWDGEKLDTLAKWSNAWGKVDSEDWRLSKAFDHFAKVGGDKAHRLSQLRDWYRDQPEMMAAIDTVAKRADVNEKTGRLYHVEIPEDDEYLLWDKPLSEQPPKVKEALRKVGIEPVDPAQWTVKETAGGKFTVYNVWGEASGTFNSREKAEAKAHENTADHNKLAGAVAYQKLAGEVHSKAMREMEAVQAERAAQGLKPGEWPADLLARYNAAESLYVGNPAKGASQMLHQAGIAGIKYRDGGSRSNGDGSHNYVLFNDEHAQIVAKESRPRDDDNGSRGFARNANEESKGYGGGRGPAGYNADEVPPPPRNGPASAINRILGHGIDSVGAKVIARAHAALPDPVLEILHEAQMAISPMGAGSPRAQASAKDFANTQRNAAYQWNRVRTFLRQVFTPEEKRLMWEAADEHGVLLRRGEEPGQYQGLNRLNPNVRSVVEELQGRADAVFAQAKALGMVTGDGLESYVPRMIVQMTATGPTARMKASPKQAKRGGNLSTTTGQLRQRKYETVEETEAAAKSAFGENTEVVRDIETLAIATHRLEQAVAGRILVDKIKAMSKDAMGGELVTENKPDNADAYFTMDHPALTKWAPRFENGKVVLKADGDPVMDAKPLWISKEFEGPLKAVLTSPTGALVRVLGELKAKQMSVIMYSPLMHNAVIWGKAFPVDPVGMLVMKPYRDGSGVRADPALMSEAIRDGMDPIGKKYFNQDIAGIAAGEGLDMVPGRSWTARLLGSATDLASPEAGQAVRRAIDKAGDVWHDKFLWDRIADLQAGIWSNLKAKFLKQGMDEPTAGRLAAHFANRYAGALPMEGLSKISRTLANILLFSRSFTLGNIAAFKDLTMGLPSDVRAQIERDSGPLMREMAQGATRRKAAGMLIMEVAMAKVALSLAAAAIAYIAGTQIQWPWQNEPDKTDRFLIEHDANHTAWYGRLPVGKVQEDQWNWLLAPRDTLIKKLSPYGRLMYGVAANDRGFGKPMFEPGPTTPKSAAHNIYNIVSTFLGGMLPEGQMQAAHDLYTGETNNRAMTTLQAFLPVTGVTISKGYPGGEAKGDIAAFSKQVDFDYGEQRPEIARKIMGGDIQGARQQMTDIGLDPRRQMLIIRSTINPGRMSRNQIRSFMVGSTPEQRGRFEADEQRVQTMGGQ